MELRHCKYFVAVAEELNFRRAAERLHMEQPPLSRQIRQLEAELGVALFHRDRQGVTLTEAGQVFLEQARLTLAQAEQATQMVKQMSQSKSTKLKIGFSVCAFDRLVPKLVQTYRESCPAVEVQLVEMSSSTQAKALEAGEIDCGFLHLPIEGNLTTETLLKEPVVVVLPKSHPLADQKSITLRSLAHERFIMCPKETKPDWHREIVNACEQAGFQPNIVQEVTPPNAMMSFVAAGAGISFLTSEYYIENASDVVIRPLEDVALTLEIAIAWQPNHSSTAVESFVDIARQMRCRLLDNAVG